MNTIWFKKDNETYEQYVARMENVYVGLEEDIYEKRRIMEMEESKHKTSINKKNVLMAGDRFFNRLPNESQQNYINRVRDVEPTTVTGHWLKAYKMNWTEKEASLKQKTAFAVLKNLREDKKGQGDVLARNNNTEVDVTLKSKDLEKVTKLLEQLVELLIEEKNQRKANDTEN